MVKQVRVHQFDQLNSISLSPSVHFRRLNFHPALSDAGGTDKDDDGGGGASVILERAMGQG